MNGNCHLVFGTACATMVAVNITNVSLAFPNITTTSEYITLLMLGGMVGGILPDIDNPTSYVGRLTVPLSTAIGRLSKAFGKTGANHRGVLHDFFVYVVGLFLSYNYFPSLVGVFIGALSHLYLDMFNPSGVPFCFGMKRIHLGKIKSGSKESVIFTWANVLLVIIIGLLLRFKIT